MGSMLQAMGGPGLKIWTVPSLVRMLYVEVFCAPIQLKKSYPYTRNNCQDLSQACTTYGPRPT